MTLSNDWTPAVVTRWKVGRMLAVGWPATMRAETVIWYVPLTS